MKNILTIIALLLSTHAHAWNKMIDCNNGELVIDHEYDQVMNRPNYQIVMRGQPLNYLNSTGAIDSRMIRNGEFILPLSPYDGEFMAFYSIGDGNGSPIQYRKFWVSRYYNNITIQTNMYIGSSSESINRLMKNPNFMVSKK